MRYVIITPAKNEQEYIAYTIERVIAQTVLPFRWIIVDDGSTDNTAKIIHKYAKEYSFITVLRRNGAGERSFGRKVRAFNAGLECVSQDEYDIIGNLDADILLPPSYYETMIAAFEDDPRLGLTGGVIYTKYGTKFYTGDTARDSVGGGVQLFRASCFRDIGGYIPIEHGGIDAAAEIMARSKGWAVQKQFGINVYEQRRTGSVGTSMVKACYREGRRFHSLGYSSMFQVARCLYRMKGRPFVIGSMIELYGFSIARLTKEPVLLEESVVAYLRSEQMNKLREMVTKRS